MAQKLVAQKLLGRAMTRGQGAGPYDQGGQYFQHPQHSQHPQPAGPPQQWAPPPRKRRKTGQTIVLSLLAAGISAMAVAGWMASKSSPDMAAVGDCVARDGDSNIRIVDCTDPKRQYEVVGKVPDKTQVQFSISSRTICKAYPQAKTAFWKGESGGDGYVLCLAPVK
ncbi:hypothetical protein [Actinomadura sp. 9N407]|uniref:LppU/SCO3897 family protein n=1 Tax=Actinomadura sp. 9N407 TaxID=3375154 RepID=UPI0037B76DE5